MTTNTHFLKRMLNPTLSLSLSLSARSTVSRVPVGGGCGSLSLPGADGQREKATFVSAIHIFCLNKPLHIKLCLNELGAQFAWCESAR